MPSYHTDVPYSTSVAGVPLLSLHQRGKGHSGRGPAPVPADPAQMDIVDQTLDFFKANILFSSYEIKAKSDLVLVYCTLYVVLCLKRLAKLSDEVEAKREMYVLAVDNFALPGDSHFPLNAFFSKAKTESQKEELRRYLTQLGLETGFRLAERVFNEKWVSVGSVPAKWWTCFAKKKFLKVELTK